MNLPRAFAVGLLMALAGCAAAPARVAETAPAPVATSPVPPVPAVSPGMQYLYGSAEAAAASEQAYNALAGEVTRRLQRKREGTLANGDSDQAVLAPGSTLADPRWVPCGDKPPAVVFDVDETVLLNLGFEYDEALHPGRAFDPSRWGAWEKTGGYAVAPVPGALRTMRLLRDLGVTVVFNTNRSAANAEATARAIEDAGLGPAVHGTTLFLKGDLGSGSGKDSRRAAIAERYCVLAMGGDQLGDFTDLFTGTPAERRVLAGSETIARVFGLRWFVLPNPVYGSALKGGIDDVFQAGKRWPAATDSKE